MALYRSAFIACLLLMGACTQAEGEACQVDSDCEDGLICSISGLRGTCRTDEPVEDSGTPNQPDASVSGDASVRDAAQDSAVEDSAVEDSAVEDSAVEDSAVEDSAVMDSASPDDDAG